MRNIKFANGEYYHIFNRGTDKRKIFMRNEDLQRFFQSMCEFNTPDPIGSIYEKTYCPKKKIENLASKNSKNDGQLVNFICYCLNPNHYHFLLKQVTDKGIEKFIHRLGTGYTKYFNNKYKRSGVLFQGKFKAVHIDSNEQLLHTSVYVNQNDKIHTFGSRASKKGKESVSLSSWDEYTGKSKFNFCRKNDVLGQFKNKKEYKQFAERTLPSILERKEMLKELEE
jgi:putative transposase